MDSTNRTPHIEATIDYIARVFGHADAAKIQRAIAAAILAERERWRAALFIPPGSPVDTDEEIRMAIDPPEVVAGIIHGAKNVQREACARVAETVPELCQHCGGKVTAACVPCPAGARDDGDVCQPVRGMFLAAAIANAIRGLAPTVIGITRDGRPVTR